MFDDFLFCDLALQQQEDEEMLVPHSDLTENNHQPMEGIDFGNTHLLFSVGSIQIIQSLQIYAMFCRSGFYPCVCLDGF